MASLGAIFTFTFTFTFAQTSLLKMVILSPVMDIMPCGKAVREPILASAGAVELGGRKEGERFGGGMR